MSRPRIAFVSHVVPIPGDAGQQRRVGMLLEALAPVADVHLVTYAPRRRCQAVAAALGPLVTSATVLPSRVQRSLPIRAACHAYARLAARNSGLKVSNHLIGDIELTPRRVARACAGRQVDVALFQYWHAHRAIQAFPDATVTVLDMHDILWQSLQAQLERDPRGAQPARVEAYRDREEAAWREFDVLLAINEAEATYARSVAIGSEVIAMPMGIELGSWPYQWRPAMPPLVAFYGALGDARGEADALRAHAVMEAIWENEPDARLRIIGSNPTDRIRAFAADRRVEITGFVDSPGNALAEASCLICPFTGTYGFRSRLIEVMATGVPIVCSRDAVYGMGLGPADGLDVVDSDQEMAAVALDLIGNRAEATRRSALARRVAEDRFGVARTYGAAVRRLLELVGSGVGTDP